MTAGYPLEKIVVGSEGTLGIITQLTIKLVPLPKATAHVLAVFPSAEQALSLVTALPKAGITPTCLEFMDYDSSKSSGPGSMKNRTALKAALI